MKTQGSVPALVPRTLMFTAACALTIYITHFVLPAGGEGEPSLIQFNPLAQIGLFIVLTIFGILVGFWITFGDIVNRSDNKEAGGR